MKLEGKVAVVTGGGTGIGRSIAIEFARAGADVVIASRRKEILEQVASEIETLGRNSLAVQTDVSHKADVEKLFQETTTRFKTVDILVNCASVGDVREQIIDLQEEDWDRAMDINVKGYFLCSQAAGKILAEKKSGAVVNIASVSAVRPRTNGGMYNITKAAEVMLTLVLAKQLAAFNIRVNAIAPGFVKTDMTKELWSDPERLERVENRIPLGHLGEPEDIAKTALFLASDDAKHITGHTVVIDGGQLLL